jgi:hypothetical protein
MSGTSLIIFFIVFSLVLIILVPLPYITPSQPCICVAMIGAECPPCKGNQLILLSPLLFSAINFDYYRTVVTNTYDMESVPNLVNWLYFWLIVELAIPFILVSNKIRLHFILKRKLMPLYSSIDREKKYAYLFATICLLYIYLFFPLNPLLAAPPEVPTITLVYANAYCLFSPIGSSLCGIILIPAFFVFFALAITLYKSYYYFSNKDVKK